MASYADRLFVHESSGKHTSVEEIQHIIEKVRAMGNAAPVVVVDYLQKVPLPGSTDIEEERVTTIVSPVPNRS